MTVTTAIFAFMAAGGILAAIFFLIKKFGKTELQAEILEDVVKHVQDSAKQAREDEKNIADMSDADKRDELSK